MTGVLILILGIAAVGLFAWVILDDLFDFSEPLSEEEKRKIINKT